ncbi:MAG: hypothetical protein VKK62_04720 [Synechococcaceae cyanobacterium]|nr:hypothetical protein [Synechococcaceae cyanobacterium]
MPPQTLPLPLQHFVTAFKAVLQDSPTEADLLQRGGALLSELIGKDDWLPEPFRRSGSDRYRQYLLYRDPTARFSIVSFVWGPGQSTPIHDHTVWGLIGVLQGTELAQRFAREASGRLEPQGPPELLRAGRIDAVSPRIGDIHQVSNGSPDSVSISIHVYGADIGAVSRHVFRADGTTQDFISGYSPLEA